MGVDVVWGVYETDESVHVIQCDEKGIMLNPHTLDDFCICHAELLPVEDSSRYVMIHNEVH